LEAVEEEKEREIFLKIELDEHDGFYLLGKDSMILMESLMTFTTLVEKQMSTLLFHLL